MQVAPCSLSLCWRNVKKLTIIRESLLKLFPYAIKNLRVINVLIIKGKGLTTLSQCCLRLNKNVTAMRNTWKWNGIFLTILKVVFQRLKRDEPWIEKYHCRHSLRVRLIPKEDISSFIRSGSNDEFQILLQPQIWIQSSANLRWTQTWSNASIEQDFE